MANEIVGIFIAAYDEHDEITAPPARMLQLEVINGTATLRFRQGGLGEMPPAPDRNAPMIDVPARALLLALQAAISDDQVEVTPGEHDGWPKGK